MYLKITFCELYLNCISQSTFILIGWWWFSEKPMHVARKRKW